ncbi:Uncharacterized protein HZ326_28252, partial [Fusarium oxysporum f. sp. albedinis]
MELALNPVRITFGWRSSLRTQNSAVKRLMYLSSISRDRRLSSFTAYSSSPIPFSFFLRETCTIPDVSYPTSSWHLPYFAGNIGPFLSSCGCFLLIIFLHRSNSDSLPG